MGRAVRLSCRRLRCPFPLQFHTGIRAAAVEHAETHAAEMKGRPPITTLRANVSLRTRKRNGITIKTWDAYVRRAHRRRTYLRSYDTHAEALAACETFIRDGSKPGPCRRGPHKPEGWILPDTKPKPVARSKPARQATASDDRLEMIRRIARRLAFTP